MTINQLSLDSNKTWKLVDERLAVETDPVVRRNLALVSQHMKAEARGDIEGVLETLCENPIYRQNFPGGFDIVAEGTKQPVREFYNAGLVESGAHRLEFDVIALVADQGAVYTEGHYLQAFPGRTLQAMGIEVDDPDAFYAAEADMVILWPRDADTGLLRGEEIWMDRDMFAAIADRKIESFAELSITPALAQA